MLQVLWYLGRGLYKRADYLRQLQWGGNNAHNVKISAERQWHWHWDRLVLGHDPTCVLVPFAPPYILNLVLQPPHWFDKLSNIHSFSAYVSQSWFLLFATKTDWYSNYICDLSKMEFWTGFLDLNWDEKQWIFCQYLEMEIWQPMAYRRRTGDWVILVILQIPTTSKNAVPREGKAELSRTMALGEYASGTAWLVREWQTGCRCGVKHKD